jgi:hypothetical protein
LRRFSSKLSINGHTGNRREEVKMAAVETDERITTCPACGETLAGTVDGDALRLKVKKGYAQRTAQIEALLREKADYEARSQQASEAGDDERAKKWGARAKQVDVQLGVLGYEEESGR